MAAAEVGVAAAVVEAVAVDIEAELPEVEDAAALLVAVREAERAAAIDRRHCPRAAGTSEVAIDQMLAVPAVSEIARAASVVPVDPAALEARVESEIGRAASVALAASEIDRAASVDPAALAAPAESEIGQVASAGPEARAASAVRAVLETGQVASVDQEVSAIDLESAIDPGSEIGSRTPATDMTFGRTPTTTGITGTGTAIGAPGASARWPGV